jgi:hypothetical protein
LQVPENFALHEPSHDPPQDPPALMSHEPLHFPPQEPESSPPSHETFALPGVTLASHDAAQSAIALIDAPHFGGTMDNVKVPPAFAFMSEIAFAAALHTDAASFPSAFAPKSLARFPQAPLSSASISA